MVRRCALRKGTGLGMVSVHFYDPSCVEDRLLKYAVIAARYEDRWVFCKHRQRETFECPGGHREAGENIGDTARRELWEETGAAAFEFSPVCVYSVVSGGEETFGMLYFAQIRSFGELPPLEMETVSLFDAQPPAWTYPEIQPRLLERVRAFLSSGASLRP